MSKQARRSRRSKAAINGMLSNQTEPHSSYMIEEPPATCSTDALREFGGLGIEVTMEEGLVRVVTPIDDTPAFNAGVMANDLITHIDDQQVEGMTLSQAVDMMRGPVGTEVTLRIRRPGAAEPVEVTIERDTIRVRPVRARLEDDIGYLRVTTFNGQTYAALRKAVQELKDEAGSDGLKGFCRRHAQQSGRIA